MALWIQFTERNCRKAEFGFPEAANETSQRFDQQIVDGAGDPLFAIPQPPDPELAKQVQKLSRTERPF
jgi:hypothetical protein